jgi:hypothetical protein
MGSFIDKWMWHVIMASTVATFWASMVYGVRP